MSLVFNEGEYVFAFSSVDLLALSSTQIIEIRSLCLMITE